MPKIVSAAFKAKAKAWSFEAKPIGPKAKAKTIKSWLRGASKPRPGLAYYIKGSKEADGRFVGLSEASFATFQLSSYSSTLCSSWLLEQAYDAPVN